MQLQSIRKIKGLQILKDQWHYQIFYTCIIRVKRRKKEMVLLGKKKANTVQILGKINQLTKPRS